jgi:hypothetical protein
MATRTVKDKKMTRPLIQIDDEVREMNDEELEQHELMIAENAVAEEAAKAKAVAKAALLEKLGITEEEAALLLG